MNIVLWLSVNVSRAVRVCRGGSERRCFSTEPDGFCLGSCNSLELFDRNQREKSLVANQLTVPCDKGRHLAIEIEDNAVRFG